MFSKNAIDLINLRYKHPTESVDGVFKRVAKAISVRDEKFEKELFNLMTAGVFFPNSPCLRNAGRKRGMLHACFVLPCEDSMTEIFETVKHMATIFKFGGGVGINFSKLRPMGALLSSGGTSSGAISFMGIFDAITETVKQGGFRRGALMGILNPDHPEILSFCRAKLRGNLTNFNLSVLVSDQFMRKAMGHGSIDLVYNEQVFNTIRAGDVLDLVALGTWANGDPGMLFYDRINKDNPLKSKGVMIDCTNPCVTGDTLIAVADGRHAVPIKQLVWEGKKVPVYCADKDGWMHIRYGRKFRKTGDKVEVYKVVLDDGSFVKATPNHKFMLKNRVACQVKDLKIGDSLLRFDKYLFSYSSKPNKYWGIQKARANVYQEHRLIQEFRLGRKLQSGELVHHKDGDSFNNSWDNLLITDFPEHSTKFHNILGNNNPMAKLKLDPERFETFRKKQRSNGRERNPMKGKFHSEESKESNRQKHLGKIAWNKDLTKEIDERVASYSRKITGQRPGFKNSGTWEKGHEPWNKGVQLRNHKVVSVEFCGYEDVYNLTVDDFHNYAIITHNQTSKKSGIVIRNCSEVALPPYGACCLGSINLSKFVEGDKFDFDKFESVVRTSARALANMNVIGHFPLPQIARFMSDHNPIGVGLMGFADTLIMLGIKYDSEACIDFIKKMSVPYISGTEAVAPESFYKRIIAPTGSLSILGDCSFGIEPVFAAEYDRHISIGIFHEGKDIYKSEHCQTAYEVSPDGHLKVQAAFQEIVDGGVSKTINVPNNTSVEEIKKIYIKAWKSKVKGVTIFRDGSIEGVLRAKTKCEGEVCNL